MLDSIDIKHLRMEFCGGKIDSRTLKYEITLYI